MKYEDMTPEEQAEFDRGVRETHQRFIDWWKHAKADTVQRRFEKILALNNMGPRATQDGGAR